MNTKHPRTRRFNPAVSAFLVFALLFYVRFFEDWFEGPGGALFFFAGCAVFIGCMIGVVWRVIQETGTRSVPLAEVFGAEESPPAGQLRRETPAPDLPASSQPRPVAMYPANKVYITTWLGIFSLLIAGSLAMAGYTFTTCLSGGYDPSSDKPMSMLARLGFSIPMSGPWLGIGVFLFFNLRKFYRGLSARVEIYDEGLVQVSAQGTQRLLWTEIDHVTSFSKEMMFLPVNNYRQVRLWRDTKTYIEIDSMTKDLPELLQTIYERYSALEGLPLPAREWGEEQTS